MKYYLLLALSVLFSLNTLAQTTFEKGYIITNNNEKILCLIKNKYWVNSPSEIEYKISENKEVLTGDIHNINGFEIENHSKYKKNKVEIDKSSEILDKMSLNKLPDFKSEELFLKVLVEGDISLYEYRKGGMNRFFIKKGEEEIQQLIYKKYKTNNNIIKENNEFRQQLWNYFQTDKSLLSNTEYKAADLKKVVIAYSVSQNSEFKEFNKFKSKGIFNLSLRAGLNMNQIEMNNQTTKYYSVDFGASTGGRIGLELEYIFPMNNYKWAIILEPNYQFYSIETETRLYPNPDDVRKDTQKVGINHSTIEAPLGIRYYMFLNEKSRLFIDASLVLMLNVDSSLDYSTSITKEHYKSENNFEFGVGYNYNKKMSLELKYKNAENQYKNDNQSNSIYESKNNTLALIFGYTIF